MKRCGLFAVLISIAAVSPSFGDVVYVDGDVASSGTGLSWDEAKKTVSEALVLAASGDQVWVAEGTYMEAITLKSGVGVYGGFCGTESSLSEREVLLHPAVINASTAAGGVPADHVVKATSISSSRIDGFTLTRGRADGAQPGGDRGGGVYFDGVNSSTVVANCTIVGCTASDGGGICCTGTASPVISYCTVTQCRASDGGGIYALGPASPTISDCSIVRCNCVDNGAGIWSAAPLAISRSLIAQNIAGGHAGGLFCVRGEITDCTIDSNSSGNNGGGLYIDADSICVLMSRCFITGNVASSCGGGLHVALAYNNRLNDCIVSGNRADYGGGVSAWEGLVRFTNCIISGNTATAGGATAMLMMCASYGGGTFINCTVCDNDAPDRGGIFTDLSPNHLQNSILAYNTNRAFSTVLPNTTISSLFYANTGGDICGWSACYTGADQINALGGASANVDEDPVFVMGPSGSWTEAPLYQAGPGRTILTDSFASFEPGHLVGRLINPAIDQYRQALIVANGTSTIEIRGNLTSWVQCGDTYRIIDYRLGYGSGAIDLAIAGSAPSYDLDGNSRPVDIPGHGAEGTGTEYDIGAYEAQPVCKAWVAEWRVDFGTQPIDFGPTVPELVHFSNAGFATLTFSGSGFEITGPHAGDFTILGSVDTSPLPPGGIRTVAICFDPSSEGAKHAFLTITTNDPGDPTVNVSLVGVGSTTAGPTPTWSTAAESWRVFR